MVESEFQQQVTGFAKLLQDAQQGLPKCENQEQLNQWKKSFLSQLNQIQHLDNEVQVVTQTAVEFIDTTNKLKETVSKEIDQMKTTQQKFNTLKEQFFDVSRLGPEFKILNDKIGEQIQKTSSVIDHIDNTRQITFQNFNKILADATEQMENKVDEILPVQRMKRQPLPQEDLVQIQVVQPVVLTTRLTIPIYPVRPSAKFSLPKKKQYDFNNHLVGVWHNKWQFDFVMSDGSRSNIPVFENAVLTLAQIEPGQVVRRVVTHFDPNDHITGLKFYNGQGELILQAGQCDYQVAETLLEANERIVGVRSTLFRQGHAKHTDFQLVIGKQ